MATIKISEIQPAGSELFQDSESFLNELSGREMGNILGGGDHSFISINSDVDVSCIVVTTVKQNPSNR